MPLLCTTLARQARIIARLVPRLQLDHTTKHKSCHLLLLICMSFHAQSATNETRSLSEKREMEKIIYRKRIPRDCCCWPTCRLQSTRNTTSTVRCKTDTPVASGPYHDAQVLSPASSDPHVVPRAIRNKRNVFSLCEKREMEKIIYRKRIPRDCCCWPPYRLRSMRNTTSTVRCKTGTPVATGPYHEAQVLPPALADLQVVRRAIRYKRIAFAFALCEKREKE